MRARHLIALRLHCMRSSSIRSGRPLRWWMSAVACTRNGEAVWVKCLTVPPARVVLTASGCSAANAQSVIMDVLGGFRCPGRVEVIANREAAIRWAVKHTDSGSILLSGCGSMPWLDSHDELSSDEMVAKAALESKNSYPIAPILGIFPPTSPTPFFFPLTCYFGIQYSMHYASRMQSKLRPASRQVGKTQSPLMDPFHGD